MSAILTALELRKRLGDRVLFDGVSLTVHERDRIGLIGRNGAGKSTLLRMFVHGAPAQARSAVAGDLQDPDALEDALEPDSGQLSWRRELRLTYVPQEPRIAEALTVREVLLGGGPPEHEVLAVADGLRVARLDARIGELSLGERRRVALARAISSGADVLALDEPTNHLDARTIEWLESRLLTLSAALIVVTHDRYFLDRVATRIAELDRGKLYGYEGDYSEFLLRQAERMSVEQEHEAQRAAFVRREIEWIRRSPSARRTKAKARIDRFDAAVAAAPGAAAAPPRQAELRLPTGPRLGSTIVELEAVTRELGGKTLFRDLTLVMKPGDRIGIVGDNGAGKTTLVRTILGESRPDAGVVTIGANTKFGYLEQGRSELVDDRTVTEEVAEGYDFVELPEGKVHVRGFLRMLAFAEGAGEVKIGQLSGGERNRVQLAKLLRRGGNVLILDEPTNDLDLVTLGALEEALLDFPGCAFIVSHDRWFLDRVATAILAFEGDGQVVLYEGSYTFYQERREQRERAQRAAAPAAEVKARRGDRRAAAPAVGPRKLTFKERRELAGMEEAISVAEARVAELEVWASDPQRFKTPGEELRAKLAELDAQRAEVEALYARWQELEQLAAAEPT
ncbi:MAG: ABC-F family ATP-binding cassette domain-containing protein [Kofleriaceae bacterium]